MKYATSLGECDRDEFKKRLSSLRVGERGYINEKTILISEHWDGIDYVKQYCVDIASNVLCTYNQETALRALEYVCGLEEQSFDDIFGDIFGPLFSKDQFLGSKNGR